MDFSPELYETLRRYSEADEPINVTVINQFQQEFTISGTMPIFHHTRDMGYECSGVHLHYIILNFDKNDSRATIKLFCPSDTTATEVHPLTIKKITNNYGNTLFENENYPWVVLKIRQDIIDRHQTVNFWDLNPQEEKIAKKYLGKAPVCLDNKYPEIKGKKCLVTGVIRGLYPNSLAFYLKHEDVKTFAICRIKYDMIEQILDLNSENQTIKTI